MKIKYFADTGTLYMRVTSAGGPISAFAVDGEATLDFLVAIPPQIIHP